MAQRGFLTGHGGVNLGKTYATENSERAQGEILGNATTFRFDGPKSDLMPGEIGAGVFWTCMVDLRHRASAEDVATPSKSAGRPSS